MREAKSGGGQSKDKKKITHKELLTFSNLTNLSWEFVNLKAIEENDTEAPVGGEETSADELSTQLDDLLAPKIFARRDEEGEVERYVYGTDSDGNYLSEEEELVDLRKNAGIAMEYLEKMKQGNEEGEFLKDWEVIYGGDNYKVIADYLDRKWLSIIDNFQNLSQSNTVSLKQDEEINYRERYEKMNWGDKPLDEKWIQAMEVFRERSQPEEEPEEVVNNFEELQQKIESGEEKPYPSREEIEKVKENNEAEKRIKKMINATVDFASKCVVIDGAAVPGGDFKLALNLSDVSKAAVDWNVKGELRSKRNNLITSLIYTTFFSCAIEDRAEILGDSINKLEALDQAKESAESEKAKQALDDFMSYLESIVEGKNAGLEDVSGITFYEKLNMCDTGFRVVVFKKEEKEEKNIVIAYQGEEPAKQQPLPPEMELLQMVHKRIKSQHPDANIIFTGCNRGADLSFLTTLLMNQRKKYTVKKGDNLRPLAGKLLGKKSLWNKRFKQEDGSQITDEMIHPGEEIYYYGDAQARLFYTESCRYNLMQYINFDEKDIAKDYKKLKMVDIGINFVEEGLEDAVVSGVQTLVLASIIALAKSVSYISGYVVAVIVSGIVNQIFEWLQSVISSSIDREIAKERYKRFKKLKFVKEKQKLEGYIKDKFFELDSFKMKVETYDFGNIPEKFSEIEIKKEHGVYLITNGISPIVRPIEGTSEYLITAAPPGNFNSENFQHWQLIKNDKGVYEIKRNIYFPHNIKKVDPDAIIKKENLRTSDKDELAKGEMMINLMKLISNMQRAYLNKREGMFKFIYPAKKEDKTTSDQKKDEKLIKIAEKPPGEEKLKKVCARKGSEFLFFPYLKEGEIKSELRKGYIASVVQTMILRKIYGNPQAVWDQGLGIKYNPPQYNSSFEQNFIRATHRFCTERKTEEEYQTVVKEKLSQIVDDYIDGEFTNDRFSDNCYLNNSYAKQVIKDKLYGEPKKIKEYYELKMPLTEKPVIKFKPKKDSSLEYKYNPGDFILGINLLITGVCSPGVEIEVGSRADFYRGYVAKCKKEKSNPNRIPSVRVAENSDYTTEFDEFKEIEIKPEDVEEDRKSESEDSKEPIEVALNKILPVYKKGRA